MKITQAIGFGMFVVFVVALHEGSKESRNELKQERACLEQAKDGAGMRECFRIMDLNNK